MRAHLLPHLLTCFPTFLPLPLLIPLSPYSPSYLFSFLPSSVLLPPSHLPLTPMSLTGQLFPGLSASLMRPGMVEVGRSSLDDPFSIPPHPSLSGKRTPPQGWIVGSLLGTPDLTYPLSGPVPWRPSLNVVQPQDPATLCCLSPSHVPLPGKVSLPGTPCFSVYEDCRSAPLSPVLQSHAPPASPLVALQSTPEPHQVWEKGQAHSPRQADPGGLRRPGPLTPGRGLPSLPSGQRNHLPPAPVAVTRVNV